MNKLTPVLKVNNVKESIAFYEGFNFQVVVAMPDADNPEFAILVNSEVEIMLQQTESIDAEYTLMKGKEPGGTFTLYMDLGEVKPIYDICKDKGIEIVIDLHKTPYGQDEFAVLDNNGYILVFTKR